MYIDDCFGARARRAGATDVSEALRGLAAPHECRPVGRDAERHRSGAHEKQSLPPALPARTRNAGRRDPRLLESRRNLVRTRGREVLVLPLLACFAPVLRLFRTALRGPGDRAASANADSFGSRRGRSRAGALGARRAGRAGFALARCRGFPGGATLPTLAGGRGLLGGGAALRGRSGSRTFAADAATPLARNIRIGYAASASGLITAAAFLVDGGPRSTSRFLL